MPTVWDVMNSRSKNLSELFQAAVAFDSEAEREEFVDATCQDDDDLREQLQILLESHQKAGRFLSTPPPELAVTQLPSGESRPSVLQLIGQTLEGELPRIVLDSSPDENSGPIVRPKSAEIPKQENDNRYQLQGEIARGGMGAILKGRDADLGRDLAVKVLLAEHKEKPAVIQRFVEEAQIGGQLQHPGIAPVYELGQFKDQRPFFTMKLVKGKTLSALLEDRSSPEEDRAKFLGIFEQICQTMAYAHSRGVIHRDLKPSNIMVGAFGEVQVMDWGLAKVLGEGGVVDEKRANDKRTNMSIIQTIRSLGSDSPASIGSASTGSHTQMGSVMGTPAYMPPEQALGEIDRLDQRSDVFGLGAILSEILTGEPPYTGEDHTEVFRKASRAKLEECFSRLEDHCIDSELLQIIGNTLKPEPEDRIRDAGVLSDRVSSYLASLETRMRAAELAKVEANTRAIEERKRQKVIMALAASVLLTMGLAGGGYLWSQKKEKDLQQARNEKQLESLRRENDRKTRLAQLEARVRSDLSLVQELAGENELNRSKLIRAVEICERAKSMTQEGDANGELLQLTNKELLTLRDRIRNIDLVDQLEKAWEWEIANGTFRYAGQQDARKEMPNDIRALPMYETAFRRWGIHPSTTAVEEVIPRIQQLPAAQREAVLVSLERWKHLASAPKTLEQWKDADWHVLSIKEFHSKLALPHEILEDGSILLPEPAKGGDQVKLTLACSSPRVSAFRIEAIPHESLIAGGPGTRHVGGFEIEKIRFTTSNTGDQALQIRSAVADYHSQSAPVSRDAWGILNGRGKPYNAFFELSDELERQDNDTITLEFEHDYRSLGRLRISVSNPASAAFTKSWLASAIGELTTDPWRQNVYREIASGDRSALLARVSDESELQIRAELDQVQLAEALLSMDENWMLENKLDLLNWTVVSPESMKSENGAILTESGDRMVVATGSNAAEETIELTIPSTIDGEVVRSFRLQLQPANQGREGLLSGSSKITIREIAFSAEGGTDSQEGNQRLDSELSLRIKKACTPDSNPNDIRFMLDGDLTTAALALEQVNLVGELAESDLEALSSRGAESITIRIHTGLGTYFLGQNAGRFRISASSSQLPELETRKAGMAILRRLRLGDEGNYWAHVALARAYTLRPEPDLQTALRHASAAAAIRPQDLSASANLLRLVPIQVLLTLPRGEPLWPLIVHHASRIPKGAREHRALDGIVKALVGIGWTQLMKGHYQESQNALERALELEPTNSRAYLILGHALKNGGILEDAIASYEKSIEISGWSVAPGISLSDALVRAGRDEEALVAIQKSIEIDPNSAVAWDALGHYQKRRGELDTAIESFRKATESNPATGGATKMAPFHLNLGMALLDNGNRKEAREQFEQSVAEDPDFWQGYRMLGRVDLFSSDFDKAEEQFRAAVLLAPNKPDIYVDLATALEKQGEHKEAADIRTKLLPVSDDPSTLNNAAWALVSSADPDAWRPNLAVKMAEKASEVEPETNGLLNTLGVAYYRAGEWEKAVTTLQQSIQVSKGANGAFDTFFLAMAHWQIGNEQEAHGRFDEAMTWMTENASKNPELIRFRSEAEDLLGIDRPPRPR